MERAFIDGQAAVFAAALLAVARVLYVAHASTRNRR